MLLYVKFIKIRQQLTYVYKGLIPSAQQDVDSMLGWVDSMLGQRRRRWPNICPTLLGLICLPVVLPMSKGAKMVPQSPLSMT